MANNVKKFKNPVVIPVKIEKDFKNSLVEHCNEKAMTFTGLIRMLLQEYAERERIGGK